MRTSDLAQALFAGLLQRLGAQHRNEAMIELGKRLAERITSNEAVVAEPRKRPSATCKVARGTVTSVHALHPANTDCPQCNGKGELPQHDGLRQKTCPRCNGRSRLKATPGR